MRRSGNVCDTLVFLLVAALLPAWLLGHLYLAFFPSSGSSSGVANASDAVASLSGEGSSAKDSADDGAIALLDEGSDGATPADANTDAVVVRHNIQWQQKLDGFKTKFSSLSSENQNLTMKATKLEDLKYQQEKEIADLKSRIEQFSNAGGAEKMASVSTELRDAQNDYAQLDREFKSIQQEKSQLASQVMELESKNQQLATSAGSSNKNEGLQKELEAQIQTLETQLREAQRDLVEQRRLAEQMNSERPGDSETNQALIAASEKLLGEANQEKSRLQGRVNELITALDSANSDLASQKKQLADSNNQLQQVNAKYALTLKRLTGDSGDAVNVQQSPPDQTPQNPAANEQYRNYVSSRGNKSRLAFIRWAGDDQVVVRSFANKRLYQVAIERFSVSDQQYLRTLKPANAK